MSDDENQESPPKTKKQQKKVEKERRVKGSTKSNSKKGANKGKPRKQIRVSKKNMRLQDEEDSDFDECERTIAHSADDSTFSVNDPNAESKAAEYSTTEEQEYDVNIAEDLHFDVNDGFNDSEKILEGVLKQTRSGRQPKRKSQFTIDIDEPKKQKKRLRVANLRKRGKSLPRNPSKSVISSPSVAAMNYDLSNFSPGQLIFLAESTDEDGVQVVQLLMLSPPVTSLAQKPAKASPILEHDYTKHWSCEETSNTITGNGNAVLGSPESYFLPSTNVVRVINLDDSEIQQQLSTAGDFANLTAVV